MAGPGTGRTEAHTNDPVRSVMRSPVVAIEPDTTLRAAAAVMRHRHIGAVAVARADGLVGVLSERDVVQALADGQDPDVATVAGAMTGSPRPVDADTPLWAAAMLMLQLGVRHLPVTAGGRPVGMLSIRDALTVFQRDRIVEPRTDYFG